MLFNNKKKVVLVINHKDRDLCGLVLMAFWLNSKWGIIPIITHTRNEISCLIKHKPDVIITENVKHYWQEEWLEYAQSQKTVVAVYPGEGLPLNRNDNDMFYRVITEGKYLEYVDLFLLWGPIFIESFLKINSNNTLHKELVGVTRFDYYTKKYASMNMSKSLYFDELDLKKENKSLLWLTSTCYANYNGGLENFIKQLNKPNASDSSSKEFLIRLAKIHQKVFDFTCDYIIKIIKDFPHLNIIIKIHPFENKNPYYEKFNQFNNVRIIVDTKIPLSSIIKYSDIQINWRCTTAVESWVSDINKPILFPNLDVDLNELAYMDYGNDPFDDYPILKRKLNYYLNGGEVSQDLIMTRKSFINDFLTSSDGNSAERCVDAINKYISGRKPPQRSIYNYKQIIRYMKKYRFNPNWLASKRDEKHEKYIPSELIHHEMKRLINHFKKDVEYIVEI